MRRAGRIALWALGVFAFLIIAAGVGIYVLLHSAVLLNQAQTRASKATGRTVTIGSIDVDWSWTPHILLRKVDLANPDWAKEQQMFSADTIEFAIKPWPLLGGHIVLPYLHVDAPKVALEKRADGASNWDFNQNPVAATAVAAVRPAERSEAPVIGQIEITKGKISYRDASRKLSLDGDIDLAAGEAAGGAQEVKFNAKGTLEDKPLKLDFAGGSIAMLRDSTQPYPLDLEVNYGKTLITVKGKVGDPFTFENADVQMHLKGDDLADLFLQNIELQTFFQDSKYVETTGGKVGGKVVLQGNGKSLADVLGGAEGAVQFGMTGGSFSELLLALADLDIQNALFLYITDDHRIPVRCVAGGLTFVKGNAKFSRTLIDTKDSVVYVKGNLDLKSQTTKTELDADSKVVSVLNIPAPILIEGKIRSPKFSLGKGFPLPVPRIGDAKDAPCSQMLEDILKPS